MVDPSNGSLAAERGRGYRFYVLFTLFLVYTFNFIDRQIVGILAGPIKADLGLSDTQLGLMGGIAFALFYTALGIPIALLADRFNRAWIVTISLALWSGFTALCGYTHGFWQLFLCRVGVGVGEAGGVAPSYSLISDYFPPAERARAFAVFSFGIPVGSAAGILFGGLIAAQIDWRMAFFACGAAGLVLAPLMAFTVREPVRGRFDPPGAKTAAPPLGEVLRTLAGKSSFWLIAFGASSSSALGYGLAFWMPQFLGRSFGMSLARLSIYYSAMALFGGLFGIWMGGYLGDRLGRTSKAAYALVPATAFVLSIPFYAVGMLSTSLVLAFFVFLVPTALGLVWLGPVITSIQQLVPPAMRATASAVFLFINNLIGIGFGIFFFGKMSDVLGPRFGAESLRYSILIGLVFYVIAATLLYLASQRLERDWHR
ncbi:MAG TPA: MFS transporter [Thermoanaerobaculia bacterium]|nr:MFS transporter [Thermoanaerobaculia bacterium]